MRLTRAGFFADFYVYPCTAAALGTLAIVSRPRHWSALGVAFVAGLVTWTLLEYLLHRWVFHHAPWVRPQHEAHHHDPKALVGTPTWLSFVLILLWVMLPSTLAGGLAIGSGFTAGVVLGYLWYGTVHYGAHHWHVAPGSYFSSLKRRHAIHHHAGVEGNFGVTTQFWDRVFGSQIAPPGRSGAQPARLG
jgi:sterol desaturase/sphingolipid hydroxylase (fatty acid hydroxylase superfamily)